MGPASQIAEPALPCQLLYLGQNLESKGDGFQFQGRWFEAGIRCPGLVTFAAFLAGPIASFVLHI
jgi:hypothetical protein